MQRDDCFSPCEVINAIALAQPMQVIAPGEGKPMLTLGTRLQVLTDLVSSYGLGVFDYRVRDPQPGELQECLETLRTEDLWDWAELYREDKPYPATTYEEETFRTGVIEYILDHHRLNQSTPPQETTRHDNRQLGRSARPHVQRAV